MNAEKDEERIDRLISEYLKHTLAAEEEKELKSWTDESQDNMVMLFELEALANAGRPVTKDRTEAVLNRIHSRIRAEEEEFLRNSCRRRHNLVCRIKSLCAAAAVAIIVSGAFFLWHGNNRENEENKIAEQKYVSYYNDGDEVMTYVLQDGSSVMLKPNSKLECCIWPGSGCRMAVLDGEAFFDIARDTLRPFTVRSRYIDVNVLGTAFYVKAFDNAGKVEVGLERGSVSITGADSGNLFILKPNQKAIYDVATGFMETETIDVENFIHEKYDITMLEAVTADDIARHIRNTYGLDLTICDVNPEARFNLSYRNMSDINELIRIIARVTGGRCMIATDK